jgi:hypothetical protein
LQPPQSAPISMEDLGKRAMSDPPYRRPMPPHGMIFWLAHAAREAREAADRKQVHIAAEIDRDQSVITNFEKGKTQPRELDRIIAGYASDLEIPEYQLWERALVMWRENQTDPLTEAPQTAAELAAADAKPGGRHRRSA